MAENIILQGHDLEKFEILVAVSLKRLRKDCPKGIQEKERKKEEKRLREQWRTQRNAHVAVVHIEILIKLKLHMLHLQYPE